MMISKKNVVAIILARGGSKSLRKKNIQRLAGKPLLAYTIEAAQQSEMVDRVIVSTDDEEIAEIAIRLGAEIPFIRPPEYATDNSTSEIALKHAVKWLKDSENYIAHIVVYLQTTDLFRKKGMIDQCVSALLDDSTIDSAFMGLKTHKNYWRKIDGGFVRLAEDIPYGTPRQIREPIYREDTGIALATRFEVVMSGKRLGEKCRIIPYEHDIDFIDIHSEFDLWLSDLIIKQRRIYPNS